MFQTQTRKFHYSTGSNGTSHCANNGISVANGKTQTSSTTETVQRKTRGCLSVINNLRQSRQVGVLLSSCLNISKNSSDPADHSGPDTAGQDSHGVVQCRHLQLQEAEHRQLQGSDGGAQRSVLQLPEQRPGPDSDSWLLSWLLGIQGILWQEQCGQKSGQQAAQYLVQTIQVSNTIHSTE